MAPNFRKLRMRLNRNLSLSLRRIGKCEFSTRLFSQRPVSRLCSLSISLIPASYDLNLSVTITSGRPRLRIAFPGNFNAAFLSQVLAA